MTYKKYIKRRLKLIKEIARHISKKGEKDCADELIYYAEEIDYALTKLNGIKKSKNFF